MAEGVITLVSRARTQDADGVYHDGETTAREVFVRVDSVGRQEFFAAGQAGFRPDFKFTLFHDEYRGEDECLYDGAAYAIYRTYQVPGTDDLELYAKRKAGVNAHGAQNGA